MEKRKWNPRDVIRAEVKPAAMEALSNASDRLGMTQKTIMSRLVEWAADQPESLRRGILF